MAIITIVLLCMVIGLSVIIQDYFWGSRKRELIADGKQIVENIKIMNISDIRKTNTYLRSADHFLRARIWLFDKNRVLIASSMTPKPPEHFMGESINNEYRNVLNRKKKNTEIKEIEENKRELYAEVEKMLDEVLVSGEIKTIKTYHHVFKDNIIAIALPITNNQEEITGILLLISPVKSAENFLATILSYIFGVGSLAILLSLGLSQFLSRSIIKPLVSMKESAAAMAKGDYTHKVEVKGEDEVAELGKSINSLASDLADFVDKTHRMEQLRRDFVANVSHELRTPVTIIRGYNEAMLDGTTTDPETIKRYRTLIRDETIRLEHLVKELLDISRLQARVEQLEEKVPLDSIVREVVEKLDVKAQERGVTINIDVEESCYINGIGNRLIQLVMILADNAVKYSKEGGNVFLFVKKLEDKVYLVVEDDGIGIAPEEQDFVWERFYKVDKSHTKAAGGSGLGLSIAKEIIEIHNGQLILTSEINKGTKIEIVFNQA